MRAHLNSLRESWEDLGRDEKIPFSPAIAILMVVYSAAASIAWYSIKGTSLSIALAQMGLGRTRLVICLIWLGAVFFLALLWWLRKTPPWRLSGQTLIVIFSMLIFLSLFWLYGRRGSYAYWFGSRPPWGGHQGMIPYYFFVSCSVLARIVLPCLVIWLLLRRRLSDFGYGLKDATKLWWVYAILVLGVILVIVFYASTLPAFLRKYPWCKQGVIDGTLAFDLLLIYTALSFIFFVSGEAFWRGFLLFGVFRELGRLSLFFMIMPYVLGHLGKPLPETLGAILAGLVLGGLALHHRSFWLGAVSHWVVAMAMDLAALYRRGVEIVF